MIRTYKFTGLLVTSLLLAACAVGTAQPPAKDGKDGKEAPKGRPGFGGPGGFGGFGGRTPPGTVFSTAIQDLLKMTEEQKKQIADLQKEVDDKLAKILTDEQKKQLKDMREGGGRPGFGKGGPGGGPGGAPPKKKDD